MTRLLTILTNVTGAILAAIVGAIGLVLLQRWERAQKWFVLRPMRERHRTTAEAAIADAVGQEMLRPVPRPTGAEILSEAMLHEKLVADRAKAHTIGGIVRALTAPGAQGLVSRIVYAEEGRNLRSNALAVEAAIRPFEQGRQLSDAVVLRGDGFARWATEVTGAPVLLDSLDSRSRVAHNVLTWHRPFYSGSVSSSGDTYEAAHDPLCASSSTVQKPGDYDARVMALDACTYLQDQSTGTLSFLLETSESCYAATEEGDRSWGCKHIPLDGRHKPGIEFRGGGVLRRSGDRLCLLTSYVTILTGDRQLVLCRRSHVVRSGASVLSASAGGVCEPGDSTRGDRSSLGWPDPVVSCQRELREELGLTVDYDAIKPAVLFLANSWNGSGDKGAQIVATLLSFARVRESFDEVRDNLFSLSDLASGRFEVDDLEPIVLGDGPDSFFAAVSPHLDNMDQHGAMSVIYASSLLWGRERTADRYSEMLRRRGDNPVLQRVFADPSVLLKRS